jgi:hypothetical protein
MPLSAKWAYICLLLVQYRQIYLMPGATPRNSFNAMILFMQRSDLSLKLEALASQPSSLP